MRMLSPKEDGLAAHAKIAFFHKKGRAAFGGLVLETRAVSIARASAKDGTRIALGPGNCSSIVGVLWLLPFIDFEDFKIGHAPISLGRAVGETGSPYRIA